MSSSWFSESVLASVSQSSSYTLCLQHLPDCVGNLVDTETAGGLRSFLSTVPPCIPLHLRHKVKGLSNFGPVLWLHGLHGIESAHVCYSKQQLYEVRLRSVCSYPHDSDTACEPLKLSRLTGPDFVSLHPFPVQSSSARAAVSLRSHKHTVNVALSQRTLIWSCIKKTTNTLLSRLTGCQSHLSPQIVRCDQKSYDWLDRAGEELTWHELGCFEREGLWAETRGDLQLDWSQTIEQREETENRGTTGEQRRQIPLEREREEPNRRRKRGALTFLTLQTSTRNLHQHGHRHWPQSYNWLLTGQSVTWDHKTSGQKHVTIFKGIPTPTHHWATLFDCCITTDFINWTVCA